MTDCPLTDCAAPELHGRPPAVDHPAGIDEVRAARGVPGSLPE
jgi:hypothetical protein